MRVIIFGRAVVMIRMLKIQPSSGEHPADRPCGIPRSIYIDINR